MIRGKWNVHKLQQLMTFACVVGISGMLIGCDVIPDPNPTPTPTPTPEPIPTPEPTPAPTNAHVAFFPSEGSYTGADSCATCHADVGEHLLASGHWNWSGVTANIAGMEGDIHGKTDLLNNFCIAIPSNEGRCTQCHIGYGWKDESFDFTDASQIDCLVCHDGTGTYKKAPTTAGTPDEDVDLLAVVQSLTAPTRENCGACHFHAGGGDNVKHGDLASSLISPTREQDVHMGGLDFTCQKCHTSTDHGIAGMSLHSVDEGTVACTDCHTGDSIHESMAILDTHTAHLACESCHIPAIARAVPTKVDWRWSEAGQDIDPIPTDEFGKETYNKKKGEFVWDMNVRPVLRWFNGKYDRLVVGDDTPYAQTPVVIADPLGDIDDATAKLHPFKEMVGNQPADAVNKILLVPHLFGKSAGENPYWSVYDWDLAIAEGAAAAGQNYSGAYEFVDTVMYLPVSHEIAPKEMALGCTDCHNGGIDFAALGYTDDPMVIGGRDVQ